MSFAVTVLDSPKRGSYATLDSVVVGGGCDAVCKLMWVHGAFAVLTIIAFGTLTLALHDEMLRGDRAALGMALFIGIYWALRIGVDFFYYDHEDWPSGKGFVAGHILLTSLFVYLAATNLGLVVWKIWIH